MKIPESERRWPAVGPGTKIGDRYRVSGPLGSGGMASVFAGHDVGLDRPVAIKLLRAGKAGDDRATQRLLREARALARLVHPACVQVFDGGLDVAHGAFLVMERLDGEDLSRFLHTHGPLPAAVALALMEQICSAVQAVHAAGIVHRDLKPANIFVLAHAPGEIPRIKLLDFGIAKQEGDEALTDPGDILGTLAYMAPERWRSQAGIDLRTDVYALGALLYEMFAGAPPFSADTRAALRLSVLNDLPPALNERRPDLPPWLVAVVARAMSKQPSDRYSDAAVFARALGFSTPGAAPVLITPFAGTARFQVVRCLSQRADTEVYAAHDIERNRPAAIKRMRLPTGEASFRLKREFRTVAEIHHPNLVRLDGLWEERGDLLLSMELVEGTSVLEYIGNSEPRLRACMRQLVEALDALHQRGLAHCDVKPQNILVEHGSRLVLLDCGLAGAWRLPAVGVRGTTTYLAPEVFEGTIGPASDFYAVGVLLHQALAGELPAVVETPAGPRLRSAGAVASTASGDRAELWRLCDHLLAAEPDQRPTAAAILRVLGSPTVGATDQPPSALDPRRGRELFVGRQEALQELQGALTSLADGAPQIVWVQGDSGIGKTALLNHFREYLHDVGDVLVLSGRARQGDAVPFPALDEAIDELGSYLTTLPPAVADVLFPKQFGQVSTLFPTLTRIPMVARATKRGYTNGDAATSRGRAFGALRELFKRLCERKLVVWVIDDLQWIDADSRALLSALLGGADAPAMLVVGALRTGDGAVTPDLSKLEASFRAPARRLVLGPLTHTDACALLRARWPAEGAPDTEITARLAEESQGVPFFVEMLATDRGAHRDPALATGSVGALAASPSRDGLEEVLRARHLALPPVARQAMELVCVASRSLTSDVLMEAVGVADPRALAPLFAGSFVRSTPSAQGWAIEPYHSQIRVVVRNTLTPEQLRDHHRHLATSLRAQPGCEPETLVEHLAGCGDTDAAAEVALKAARIANGQLAFDRAAALFTVALQHGRFERDARLTLFRECAMALRNAGRRKDCGEMLLRSAGETADAALATALKREAGTHLLLSGAVQRGLEVLRPLLMELGLQIPTQLADTIAATGAGLAALTARGLHPAATERGSTEEALERIDLCLILAQGLAHIDLRVLPFACQGLLAALDAGDPARLQRACALFVINSVEYVPNPLVAPALQLCRQLTESQRDPYARAMLDAALAENAHFEGDFLGAEAAFEHAERTLLESCAGATRELATVRDLAVFIQYAQKGDFATQLERTQRWLAEADAANDIYHASMLRVAHAIVWIAQDQPERARAELERAQAEWLGEAGVLEVAAALYHDIIDRYQELDLLPEDPTSGRASLLRSPAAKTPFLSGYLALKSAWEKLRAMSRGGAVPEEVNAVCDIIAGLRALGLPIWCAVADALEANFDYLGGSHEQAVRRLDEAEQKFRRMSMLCLAACARRRRGEFIDSELGVRLRREADNELRALGVFNAERWTRAYWSMFDVAAARSGTYDGESPTRVPDDDRFAETR